MKKNFAKNTVIKSAFHRKNFKRSSFFEAVAENTWQRISRIKSDYMFGDL